MSFKNPAFFRSNAWNRFIYAIWSPFYNALVRLPFLQRTRRDAFEEMQLNAKDRTLLVGVGTGVDLPLLPEGIHAVGIDLSEAMLNRARQQLPIEGRDIELVQGDAEKLPFEDGKFDAVILTLILSVVSDGRKCLKEALRVLHPGDRIVVFDKFVDRDKRPSIGRKLLNLLTSVFGTDINRAFEPMAEDLPCRVLSDESRGFGGAYRVIILEKTTSSTRPTEA
ncbi:MAG: phosphatidylethanolamine/phosphatidyl-N-methylethanolamine N-methyltransferase [Verrucomicrobiales bacterium]|jgi:phosphatidylethanolamine/phosphatidyl-N-methylethanolamine N-methyltransferase